MVSYTVELEEIKCLSTNQTVEHYLFEDQFLVAIPLKQYSPHDQRRVFSSTNFRPM